jgi:protein arginine kinase
MMWYEKKSSADDVVVSTRVRLARNLEKYPFGKRLSDSALKEISDAAASVLNEDNGYRRTDMSALSVVSRTALTEKHIISRDFAAEGRGSLFTNADKDVYIMCGEEDHFRVQAIIKGFALKEAYSAVTEADDLLDGAVEYAYSEKLGYLTHCPTNLGTGMRASVMVFLPGIAMTGRLRALGQSLGKYGYTIRGTGGEGTEAQGFLYQISNQVTLGVDEDEIIRGLSDTVEQLAKLERESRKELYDKMGLRLEDKVKRSLGTMKSAVLVSSSELWSLYGDVRLGAVLGIVENADTGELDRLMINSMPGCICEASAVPDGSSPNESERDKLRADMTRCATAGMK